MKRIILVMAALCSVAAAQPNCGGYTVVGTYVMSYIGWLTVVLPDASQANYSGGILGVASIDGAGKITGTSAVAGLGPVADYDISGTIAIKPDCTGTMRFSVKLKGSSGPAETEVDRFIFLPGSDEFRLIIWDMGPGTYPAMLGTWKRIAPVPNYAEW